MRLEIKFTLIYHHPLPAHGIVRAADIILTSDPLLKSLACPKSGNSQWSDLKGFPGARGLAFNIYSHMKCHQTCNSVVARADNRRILHAYLFCFTSGRLPGRNTFPPPDV
jgi:hypothetical protein